MYPRNRRHFLADVGKGMLVASVGTALAADLGLSPAWADQSTTARLTFGKLEPLVALMQETPPEQLLPLLVQKLQSGTGLRDLVTAGALANVRTFGGQDYIGYHTFMALAPAFQMAKELPEAQRPLPVLKVLFRNTHRMQTVGGRTSESLHPIEATSEATSPLDGGPIGARLQQATRRADMDDAEHVFAALCQAPAGEAFNHLQYSVQDEVDVHRVVLAWRAWSTLQLTGPEYAHTLLRQSVRYCVDSEQSLQSRGRPASAIRVVLPKLLDQYKLLSQPAGSRSAENAWLDEMSRQIADAAPDQAAEMVAAALADGLALEDVGEAISLAANSLVLRDPGRPQQWSNDEKPAGSVHGDSVGVHASDAANAWRNIARVSNHRNAVASLIVGAYHTAGQSARLNDHSYPQPEHLERITATQADVLLSELDAAVRDKDQLRACAVVHRYGELALEPRPVFARLLQYGVSEDGALHAEKYYRTVAEEFAATRSVFRWRQLAALARVTASEYGRSAPGVAQASELLKIG